MIIQRKAKDWGLIKDDNDMIRGIWLSDIKDAQLKNSFHPRLRTILSIAAAEGEKVSNEAYEAIVAGDFRVEENSPKSGGGYGIIFTNIKMNAIKLTCLFCGTTYRVGDDADIITDENGYELFQSVVNLSDGSRPSRRDMVVSLDDTPPNRILARQEHARKQIEFVRKALAKGQKRTWYFEKCKSRKESNSYPAL